ncbi:hypothetical protein [Proteiniborus sp. MB09-C3]|uniref:hypothetical protein n=1 Tax=Proteiniborus sp. MB09-C3 TaxID=3050072 RepID=UPI00255408CB|nr:hypothetical protein [Proteiniborus sp. MB09-C3]WIV13190.1 hypothetical protein QO263_05635 [Proteiniborus sp. MB09-C3]
MKTNENLTLESIKETLDEIFAGQEILLMSLGLNKGGKIKGNKLEKKVGELTAEGNSIARIKVKLGCSSSIVSGYRRQIKNKIRKLMAKGYSEQHIAEELEYSELVVSHFKKLVEKDIAKELAKEEEIDF